MNNLSNFTPPPNAEDLPYAVDEIQIRDTFPGQTNPVPLQVVQPSDEYPSQSEKTSTAPPVDSFQPTTNEDDLEDKNSSAPELISQTPPKMTGFNRVDPKPTFFVPPDDHEKVPKYFTPLGEQYSPENFGKSDVFGGRNTILHNFVTAAIKFSQRHCLTFRPIEKEIFERDVRENRDKRKRFVLGTPKVLSFEDVNKKATNLAKGLLARYPLARGESIAIFDCLVYRDWQYTVLIVACFMNGWVVEDLGEVNGDCIEKINVMSSVIVVTKSSLEVFEVHKKSFENVKSIVNMDVFEDVITEGELAEFQLDKSREPTSRDIAFVQYKSSGTRMFFTHENIVAAAASCVAQYELTAHDSLLSISYMFINLHFATTFGGGMICLTCPDTAFPGKASPQDKGDVFILKPTVVALYPLAFELFRKAVFAKVSLAAGLKKWLFNKVYAKKSKNVKTQGRKTSVVMFQTVFKNVQAIFGDSPRLFISSESLSTASQIFFECAFEIPMVKTFSRVETGGVCVAQLSTEKITTFGPVGNPHPFCEVKIVPIPEMNYFGDSGELCVRGPMVSQFESKITKNGWFYTGAVFQREKDRFHYIDEKKNIVKLTTGEFVAIGMLEKKLLSICPILRTMCITPHSENLKDYFCCIAVVNPSVCNGILPKLGIETKTKEALANEKSRMKIREYVLEMMQVEAREKLKLKRFEIPRDVHISHDCEWLLRNGLIDRESLSPNRENVYSKYRKQIEEMYKK